MYLINAKGSIVNVIAGIFVFSSVMLGLFTSQYFLYFTALVGVMLFLSGTIGFCPMELLLRMTKIEKREARKTVDNRQQ